MSGKKNLHEGNILYLTVYVWNELIIKILKERLK